MEIKGKGITIKDLQVEDVFLMKNWGRHDTPLLGDYNFPYKSDYKIRQWYRGKSINMFNKYYGVKNENNELIAYMGIKGIKLFRRQATLGIVLDPNHTSKGYGTEILDLYLRYYFTKMKMKTMVLEVAEFNKRAYRLYEKMGFEVMGYYLDDFYDQKLDLTNPFYLEAKTFFVIDGEKIYNYIYRMYLTKKKFFQTRQ